MSLNIDEVQRLLENEELVFIATIKPRNKPHLVPLWFILEAGKIYLNTEKTSAKYKNIVLNNSIALCFGGRDTYIIEGSVREYAFNQAPLDMKKRLYQKYPKEMKEGYVTDDSVVLEVIVEKELSWHYVK